MSLNQIQSSIDLLTIQFTGDVTIVNDFFSDLSILYKYYSVIHISILLISDNMFFSDILHGKHSMIPV